MLYKVLEYCFIEDICILVFDLKVLDIKGTYVSDRNAAKYNANYFPAKNGYEKLDFRTINFRTPYYYGRLIQNSKEVMMSEVLVPNVIPIRYIKCAYVFNEEARRNLKKQGFNKKIEIKQNEFIFER